MLSAAASTTFLLVPPAAAPLARRFLADLARPPVAAKAQVGYVCKHVGILCLRL